MTKKIKVALLVFVPLVLTLPVSAHPAINAERDLLQQVSLYDLFPCALKTYKSEEVLKMDLTKKVRDTIYLRVDPSASNTRLHLSAASPPARKYRILPIVMSVLVPGAGEIYLGYYKRGAALIAMEIAAWVGFSHYRSKGLDTRERYERYADEHWGIQSWIQKHASGPYDSVQELETAGSDGSWQLTLRGSVSDNFYYMPFISIEEDKQHYYENLGKYNWFLSGWDDWDNSVNSSGAFTEHTDNRSFYRSMRVQSNDQLTTADRFIYLSIVARAFSLLETIILSGRGERDSSQAPATKFHFKTEQRGLYSTRISLEYRFK